MTVQQPRLLTQPFKVVPRGILPRFLNYFTYWISNGFFKKNHAGTNGGVTIVGVVLSAAGGLMIGFSFYVVLLLCKDSFILEKSADQWPLVLVGLFGGAIGSLIDSFLGAIFQYSGTFLYDIIFRYIFQYLPRCSRLSNCILIFYSHAQDWIKKRELS